MTLKPVLQRSPQEVVDEAIRARMARKAGRVRPKASQTVAEAAKRLQNPAAMEAREIRWQLPLRNRPATVATAERAIREAAKRAIPLRLTPLPARKRGEFGDRYLVQVYGIPGEGIDPLSEAEYSLLHAIIAQAARVERHTLRHRENLIWLE